MFDFYSFIEAINMPHCIIEYSKALEEQASPQALVQTVHQATTDSGLFEPENIKSRSVAYEHFLNGTGDRLFLHVTLRILPGRTDVQKKELSEKVLAALSRFELNHCTHTVEVVDMHGESYAKLIS